MRRKSHNLNPRKVSIEYMKDYAIRMCTESEIPDLRDRGVRGITLIDQLLKCYRIERGNDIFFEVENMDVKYTCRTPKGIQTPVFTLKHHEKKIKMAQYYESGEDDDKLIKRKVNGTKGRLTMTIVVPDFSEDYPYATRITVTANCMIQRVGSFYNDLIRKLLYIYICSYVMKSRNFIGLEGLQLHTPYTDMRCDSNNKIRYAS